VKNPQTLFENHKYEQAQNIEQGMSMENCFIRHSLFDIQFLLSGYARLSCVASDHKAKITFLQRKGLLNSKHKLYLYF